MKVAVIGAGWAGLSCAVTAIKSGHHATVFEASSAVGGRARGLKHLDNCRLPDHTPVVLDNGQHILIGAYTDTLALMRQVGVNPETVLLNLPMTLRFPDGQGLQFKGWPTPLDAVGGIFSARGWSPTDKVQLLKAAIGWQWQGFMCPPDLSVAQLCQPLGQKVLAELIEPLCVSALNTPASRASARVFLRVLKDALFGVQGGSRLLIPQVDLSALFPDAACTWLQNHGAQLVVGHRVSKIAPNQQGWRVDEVDFDAVVLATSASTSDVALANSCSEASNLIANQIQEWSATCKSLQFEAIATVYAWAADAHLAHPMLALRSTERYPAQFVFDRGQLGGPIGLLAFVVSACGHDRATLEALVLAQARGQLGLDLHIVQTVIEKRATFACTPALKRPAMHIAPGLLACGDYIEGPYPATLEGAVRSGMAAALALG